MLELEKQKKEGKKMGNARSLETVHTHTHTILCRLANNGTTVPFINMEKKIN